MLCVYDKDRYHGLMIHSNDNATGAGTTGVEACVWLGGQRRHLLRVPLRGNADYAVLQVTIIIIIHLISCAVLRDVVMRVLCSAPGRQANKRPNVC